MSSTVDVSRMATDARKSDLWVPDDPAANRFPFCLVWGPLPCLTWMFPVIGHMGICDSQGRVHDFAGPYCVGIDHFMVGKVRRIYRVPIDWEPEKWDEAIERADREYKKTVHNLFCNNCHHHTAAALTHFGIPSTQWSCWFDVMFRGQWVSKGDMLCIVLPFLVFVAVVSLLAMHSKF